MKTILIILFSFVAVSGSYACSFNVDPFCKTVNTNYPESIIVRGAFFETMDNGMIFQISETLRGEENREFIKIWDNTDFDCNGIISRKAQIFGDIGDERILSLETIDSLEQPYEILGDYRVPNDVWMETYWLEVNGDIAEGFLLYYNGPTSMNIDDVVSIIIEEGSCTVLSSSKEELDNINMYPTIVESTIHIDNTNIFNSKHYDIINISGQKELSGKLTQTIDLSMLRSGIYIFIIREGEATSKPKKLIKI